MSDDTRRTDLVRALAALDREMHSDIYDDLANDSPGPFAELDRACKGLGHNCVHCGRPLPEAEDAPRPCPEMTTTDDEVDDAE